MSTVSLGRESNVLVGVSGHIVSCWCRGGHVLRLRRFVRGLHVDITAHNIGCRVTVVGFADA